MLNWLKKIGLKMAIRELDGLEPVIASKLKEAQKKLGEIPPEQFAVTLVDEIQTWLCVKFGIDPREVVK